MAKALSPFPLGPTSVLEATPGRRSVCIPDGLGPARLITGVRHIKMKPNATLWERFEGWFVKPIEKLKECPEGDGAFLAMSTALFLCERYYRTSTNTHEQSDDNASFKSAAATDLGVCVDEFEVFWRVFRHGIQHQGMPKLYRDRNSGVEYRWNFGLCYAELPKFIPAAPGIIVICIDPWKFATLICDKYRRNPDVLERATIHAFAEVYGRMPNQAPDPTALAVTPAADAPVAPAGGGGSP